MIEQCFLLQLDSDQQASLGYDPELDASAQMLTAVSWRRLADLQQDIQIDRVLAALSDE